MQLPEEFIRQTRQTLGEERFERYMKALGEDAPVSIRVNPAAEAGIMEGAEPVAWCQNGFYLPKRPQFTFDPMLHAGCYYVQEAASMFLDHVLRQLYHPTLNTQHPLFFLDMCAAPGGKSTILLSHLPEGGTLVSNEPNPKRASILSENLQKWLLQGINSLSSLLVPRSSTFVTNNYPRDFRRAKLNFDLILCDVPCSGEGMFRKDPDSIGEWSAENVEKCWRLQREIVADAWACLRDGGCLIYSTCTLNIKENEENVRWMMEELEAEPVAIPVEPNWHITGSLLPDFTAPVYRFIPGLTRGEGLFMAVLRKKGDEKAKKTDLSRTALKTIPNDFLNAVAEAVGPNAHKIDLNFGQAIQYLRREAIVLPPETPRGIVVVSFEGQPLGLAKNIGNRANNLYPKEWRIKSTYTPKEYEAILRHS